VCGRDHPLPPPCTPATLRQLGDEEYTVTWKAALANPEVETIEDPLHKTATAKAVYDEVYGACGRCSFSRHAGPGGVHARTHANTCTLGPLVFMPLSATRGEPAGCWGPGLCDPLGQAHAQSRSRFELVLGGVGGGTPVVPGVVAPSRAVVYGPLALPVWRALPRGALHAVLWWPFPWGVHGAQCNHLGCLGCVSARVRVVFVWAQVVAQCDKTVRGGG
jgi:hypothetical protein